MRPKKHEMTREGDLFRARLGQFINLKHEVMQFTGRIDRTWIDGEMRRYAATEAARHRKVAS